jgi:hypothetical protein
VSASAVSTVGRISKLVAMTNPQQSAALVIWTQEVVLLGALVPEAGAVTGYVGGTEFDWAAV